MLRKLAIVSDHVADWPDQYGELAGDLDLCVMEAVEPSPGFEAIAIVLERIAPQFTAAGARDFHVGLLRSAAADARAFASA